MINDIVTLQEENEALQDKIDRAQYELN